MTEALAEAECALLDRIDSPSALRQLAPAELTVLADELRSFLVRTVAGCGGHFAAGLGTVELTVALHYVYDTPRDALVWDVGHQCYPHKILTGRRDVLRSIRRRGGLSGFLKRDESAYDAFGAGHSSTSISAALGIAIASERLGVDDKAVAIIGDGGMTGGLAYEALAHAGSLDTDLLVILNDNQMSISPNVGAMADYLQRQSSVMPHGTSAKRERTRRPALKPRELVDLAERAERRAAGFVVPGQWFEDLGFDYFGPVDGHDLPGLLRTLRRLRQLNGPRLLHVVTRKGQGYAPAEADPVRYHSVTPFVPEAGMPAAASSPTYTQVFGDWICQLAARDPRLVAITPAMREGSGLVRFSELYPDRYHDVGIAEQHSVTLAAGLASRGLKPVVAIYSTFMQRAYDQIVHDVALQKLPVLFAIDRAGLVGPDGATHTGAYDLSFLRCIPELVIMTPADGTELHNMLMTGHELSGPAAVRYPRASAVLPCLDRVPQLLPVGKGEVRRFGSGVALLVFGTLLGSALEVAELIDATVVNMRFVKPLDENVVLDMAREHALLVTIEENAVAGGAGSAVAECLAAHGMTTALLQLGLPDRFVEHGTRDESLHDAGLDVQGMLTAIRSRQGIRVATGPTVPARRTTDHELCSTRRRSVVMVRRPQ